MKKINFSYVYIYVRKVKVLLMYSKEFMRFLVTRDADNYIQKSEEKTEIKPCDSVIYRYTKFATVPAEIKK